MRPLDTLATAAIVAFITAVVILIIESALKSAALSPGARSALRPSDLELAPVVFGALLAAGGVIVLQWKGMRRKRRRRSSGR